MQKCRDKTVFDKKYFFPILLFDKYHIKIYRYFVHVSNNLAFVAHKKWKNLSKILMDGMHKMKQVTMLFRLYIKKKYNCFYSQCSAKVKNRNIKVSIDSIRTFLVGETADILQFLSLT